MLQKNLVKKGIFSWKFSCFFLNIFFGWGCQLLSTWSMWHSWKTTQHVSIVWKSRVPPKFWTWACWVISSLVGIQFQPEPLEGSSGQALLCQHQPEEDHLARRRLRWLENLWRELARRLLWTGVLLLHRQESGGNRALPENDFPKRAVQEADSCLEDS